jgi:hypothetical protein
MSIIAGLSLMLWKRSGASEPALTMHNFFQNAHLSKVRETPTGTWAARPEQSATAWDEMRCPPRVTSRQLDTSRGNKPKNKQNDEDDDKM